MEKNATRPQEQKQDKPTVAETVVKEIEAQANEYADQLELSMDNPAEKYARQWLIAGWCAGVTALLRQETTGRYVELVEKEKAARRKRSREAKYKILKRHGK